MEKYSNVRPELTRWCGVNRKVPPPDEMGLLVFAERQQSLRSSFLVRPEMPRSTENRAQFGLPSSERRPE